MDTTEATTQPDLFNPNRDGQPLGGGAAEPLDCKGTRVRQDGLVRPRAAGRRPGPDPGDRRFQAVVAVYEWNRTDSTIKKLVDCSTNVSTTTCWSTSRQEELHDPGRRRGRGRRADLAQRRLLPRQDGDGILDIEPDTCPTVPGIERFGGCPPELKVVPSIGFDGTGSGITIKRLIVDRVPKGAKIVAKCSGCGSQTVKAKRFGRVPLTKLVGKNVRAGTKIEIRVTLAKTGTGTYRTARPAATSRGPCARAGSALARPAA